MQQGYPILAYQSPSFESYLYYDGHDGHDFAVTGKALAAAAGGVVFKGDYGNALGRVVEIYHPNGYLTRYAHLASFENGLEVGSQVKAGQPIGTIGGSAVVDGHLTDNYWGFTSTSLFFAGPGVSGILPILSAGIRGLGLISHPTCGSKRKTPWSIVMEKSVITCG